ncbi:MAG: tyrosine recombinase [Clostridia bacterium]
MKDYYAEFSEYLEKQKSTSKNTIDSYLRDVNSFLSYLTAEKIPSPLKVDEVVVTSFIDDLRNKGKSNSTISRHVSSVRCFYKFLMFIKITDKNPAKSVKVEKIEKKLPQVLSGQEISQLLALPSLIDPKGCRDKAMLELLYSTGIRVSELINLNIEDVNLRAGTIFCNASKNRRSIPVHTSAIVAVSDYIYRMRSIMVDSNETKALFVNLNGSRLTRQGFWKIVKSYASMAGINKELTPHTLRHSFALHLLEGGVSVKDIQTMMGHADISSTQVYVQLLDNNAKSVYNEFHPRARK